jgi:predicted short-subunit dehydrogenase-like oxidoreductase (DUF2520 family)
MPKANSNKRPKPSVKRKVCIVGGGRLGTALAMALSSSGYAIQTLVARRANRARKAASLIGQTTFGLAARHLDQLPKCDLILIATPDDAITPTARRLATLNQKIGQKTVVLHTSGALSSEALAPLAQAGFHVGSLHPLVSVSDPAVGASHLRGAFYCLEGDRAALRAGRSIVRDLRGQSFSIPAGKKALYHAAAVMTSGHVVALFDIACDMLAQCGLKQSEARRVLLPLLESAVKNLQGSDPAHALTGTFARGDLATVKKHLQALRSDGSGAALQVYRMLGQRSLMLVRRSGIDGAILKEISSQLEAAKAEKQ